MNWPGFRPLNCWKAIARNGSRRATLIEDVISALEMTHASCNVVVTPAYEQARAAADRATLAWSSGQPQGKLTGVPVSIKDLVYVAGLPALGGAPANRDLVPSVDAAAVSALKSAGAIVTCTDHHLRVRLQIDRR